MDRLRVSNPTGYPYALMVKRHEDADNDVVEVLTGVPTKGGFEELLLRLRQTGEFAWVRQVTMSFWDEERGGPLDLRIPTPAPPFDSPPD